MPPPQLPLDVHFMIAHLLTDNEGELCFADLNSFLKVNRALYACLNRTLWREAVKSRSTTNSVFTQLIRTNDLASLKFFLEQDANVEIRLQVFEFSSFITTPLIAAAHLDNVPMARLLLEHGAALVQFDWADRCTFSAIHAARSAEMVQLLLDHHVDPEQPVCYSGYRPLHCYTMRGDIEAMRTLLRHGVDVDSSTGGSLYRTALHLAVASTIEAVKLLLEHGAEGKLEDDAAAADDTPLHTAVRAKKIDVVRLLLEHFPEDMRKVSRRGSFSGHTPLCEAVLYGYTGVVEVLVKGWPQGAREKTYTGDTPLHQAAAAGRTGAMRLLLESWPEGVMEKDYTGHTPLHQAAAAGNTEAVRLLVGSWPEGVREKDNKGYTPLHQAAAAGRTEAVRLLLESWPEGMREKDHKGCTPLHQGAAAGMTEAVRLLVHSWPEGVREKEHEGYTPLHKAAAAGMIGAVRLLVESWPGGKAALNEKGQTPLSVFEKHAFLRWDQRKKMVALLGMLTL